MHPRRLARSVAKSEFTRNKWDMRYFKLHWKDTARLVVERRGLKLGK